MFDYLLGLTSGLLCILVIQFAIQRSTRDQAMGNIRELLLQEVWALLNAASQVPRCYRRNLETSGQIVTPGALPRAQVMPALIRQETVATLPLDLQGLVLETSSLLEILADEADRWSELLRAEPELVKAPERYTAVSERMLELADQAMSNMVQIWVRLAVQHRAQGTRPEIRLANRVIRRTLMDRRRALAVCRSSSVRDDLEETDAIVCWEDDWPGSPAKVVELRAMVAVPARKGAAVPQGVASEHVEEDAPDAAAGLTQAG